MYHGASITSKLFVKQFSTDVAKFKGLLQTAKEVVVLSGAGISAESGIPTYHDRRDLWRTLPSTVLNTPETFREDPGLVWEFCHHRREMALKAQPNPGHIAIARYAETHPDKKVTVITQNVDGLHSRAGPHKVIEMHGTLFKTRCTKCEDISVNTDSPICPTYSRRFILDTKPTLYYPTFRLDYTHSSKAVLQGGDNCMNTTCVIRLKRREIHDPVISKCNVLLVVGTSSIVYPAAAFPTVMSAGGSIVAEFNIEHEPASTMFDFYFKGPAAKTLPQVLSA